MALRSRSRLFNALDHNNRRRTIGGINFRLTGDTKGGETPVEQKPTELQRHNQLPEVEQDEADQRDEHGETAQVVCAGFAGVSGIENPIENHDNVQRLDGKEEEEYDQGINRHEDMEKRNSNNRPDMFRVSFHDRQNRQPNNRDRDQQDENGSTEVENLKCENGQNGGNANGDDQLDGGHNMKPAVQTPLSLLRLFPAVH